MPKARHLSSAPITEAIFDIRVQARPDFQIDEFAHLREELRELFPKCEEKKIRKVTIAIESTRVSRPVIEDQGSYAFYFTSDDGALTAQFRTDGFTLSKLKPYTSWIELFPVAQKLWMKYYSTASPIMATRLALRYINNILIDQNVIDFDDYLRSAPQIPAELPQDMSAFFSKMTIFDVENELSANIVQTFQANTVNQGITLLLDIDAFHEVDVTPDDPMIDKYFSKLHEFKNLIFFNLLTERTLRLLE